MGPNIKNWPLESKIGLGLCVIGTVFARIAQNSNWNLPYTITFITCFAIGFIAISIGSSKIPRSEPLKESFFETKIENKNRDQFRQLFSRYSTAFGLGVVALILLAFLNYYLFGNLWFVLIALIVIVALLNSVFKTFVDLRIFDVVKPDATPESRRKWQSFIFVIYGISAIVVGVMIWYAYNYYGPSVSEFNDTLQHNDASSTSETLPTVINNVPSTTTEQYPAWIKGLIAEVGDSRPFFPRASLTQYEYNNQIVYYLPIYRCCDFTSTLYNKNGEIICQPEGGFSGSGGGKGKCIGFLTIRKNPKVIWTDPR